MHRVAAEDGRRRIMVAVIDGVATAGKA